MAKRENKNMLKLPSDKGYKNWQPPLGLGKRLEEASLAAVAQISVKGPYLPAGAEAGSGVPKEDED